jgi:hypothetical protein
MDFLSDLAGGLVGALAATAKVAVPVLISGAIAKHGDGIPGLGALARRIPNGAIPIFNLGVGTIVGTLASGGDVATGAQLGVAAATGATTIHQVSKIGLRALVEKAVGKGGALQKAVGPGSRLSI